MKDLNISLRDIANTFYYHDREMDTTGIDSFGKYNPTHFAQKIQIFSKAHLNTISAGECDFIFNGLLQDETLYQNNQKLWECITEYMIDTIAFLTQDMSIDDPYRKEYARFMTEREKWRNNHQGTKKYVPEYNDKVIQWRFQ